MGLSRQMTRIVAEGISHDQLRPDTNNPNKRLAALKRKAYLYKLELQEAKRLAVEVDKKLLKDAQAAQASAERKKK